MLPTPKPNIQPAQQFSGIIIMFPNAHNMTPSNCSICIHVACASLCSITPSYCSVCLRLKHRHRQLSEVNVTLSQDDRKVNHFYWNSCSSIAYTCCTPVCEDSSSSQSSSKTYIDDTLVKMLGD